MPTQSINKKAAVLRRPLFYWADVPHYTCSTSRAWGNMCVLISTGTTAVPKAPTPHHLFDQSSL